MSSSSLQYDIVSPDTLVARGNTHMVVVPGVEGDFGVMGGHAPFMSTLKTGVVNVYSDARTVESRYFVDGGFADVTPDGLKILAEYAIDLRAVDRDGLHQELTDLKIQIEACDDAVEKTGLQKLLSRKTALSDFL